MHDSDAVKAERRGLLASVAGALLVGGTGVVFFFLTDAEAILLDGLFNIVYCITGLFTLKVASLVLRGDDERFPLGYAFFEPLVNGIKGILLLGLTLMAFFSALDALFSGGRKIVLGPAVIYGVVAATVCWAVALVVRRSARRSKSPLVGADAASWIVNALVSSADLPVQKLTVRMIQPGRTRLVSAHVLLSPDYAGGLGPLDETRAKADAALRAEHPSTLVDLLFTTDERWSAPLADSTSGQEA